MTALNQLIEEQLISGLRRIEAPYRQALSILSEEPGEGDIATSQHLKVAERLQPSMKLIATCEEELLPLRKQWRDLNQTPGPQLQELLSSQSDLLKQLIEKLNQAEQSMATSYSSLGLKLDQSRMHDTMRKAYQHESA